MPQDKEIQVVTLENLKQPPYPRIICYPKPTEQELQKRLDELHSLGVNAIEFTGNAAIGNTSILGKGYVGIVVVAVVGRERYALKMRRIDGGRESFFHEAEMLKKANTVGVGPKFVAVSKNFLLSRLIEGDTLANWLQMHKEKQAMRRVLGDVLEQCWRLDTVSLDHGELSKAPRHLLVDGSGEPFIVDFETASVARHASNVTSVCQYLFAAANGIVPKLVWEVFGEKDRYKIIDALRNYKKERSRSRFEELVALCI
jgi:putative serine/threonine protein kinase